MPILDGFEDTFFDDIDLRLGEGRVILVFDGHYLSLNQYLDLGIR